uniref:C2H2-type domain-containing protein n=1 Tax=Amphimedon queenslandica TaxID=400682 RepID=A0A1X7T713_AMPQE
MASSSDTIEKSTTSRIPCTYCPKTFAFRSGLSRHIKTDHHEEHESSYNNCCHICNAKYASISVLTTHLKEQHAMTIPIETHSFSSVDEFEQWKSEEEKKCKSHYVQHTSSQFHQSRKCWKLYCNRSGKYQPRGDGKRVLKSQGFSKIGNVCIANMKVTQDTISGNVTVEYYPVHNSHSIDIAHLPIPESVKLNIAAKLQQGVPIDRILDDMRDRMSNDGASGPELLLSKQDIHNLKRLLNLQGIMKHSNDYESTCAWVEELKAKHYNPVIVFKPQGKEQTGSVNDLAKDDFLLAIQTEFQKDALQQYVIDDHGTGLPVAWAVSNREDSMLLMQFLIVVNERVGSLTPKYFMSDCAEQYFTAWCGTFGHNNTQKLVCIWHVDRAWRKSLQTHVNSQQNRVEIYHHLCVLLRETDQKSFHRLLKVVYLEGKQNRRVDCLLFTLLRLSRNLVFDQIQKTEKGKMTHRKSEINKRHASAEESLNKALYTTISEENSSWEIQSFTSADASIHYTVCKHIHIIHMKESDESKSMSNTERSTEATVPFDRQYFSKAHQGINTVGSTSDAEKFLRQVNIQNQAAV